MSDRRYLTLEGFNELAKRVKEPSSLDTSDLIVVTKLPSTVKAVGDRLIEFVITTDGVDRDKDTIDPNGWDFTDYKRNPVVLWCHDHFAPPIARARSVKREGNQVTSVAEFVPEEIMPFAFMVYRLYAEGFMNAVSVGYQPEEWTFDEDRRGINYKKQSLLEYSAVPVPANPDALVIARSKGIDTRPMKIWAERVLDEKDLSDDARHRMEVLRAVSAKDGRALILDLGDTKMAEEKKEEKKEAPPASAIKKVDRWECGTDGHMHMTEAEAKSCAEFETSVTDVTKMLQQLASHVKAGKTIREEAGKLLRSVVDDLLPTKDRKRDEQGRFVAEDEGEEKEDEGDGDEEEDDKDSKEDDDKEDEGNEKTADSDGVIKMDEAALTAAISEAVREEFNKRTGQLD